jgi:hypothetical protein
MFGYFSWLPGRAIMVGDFSTSGIDSFGYNETG